MKRYLTQEKIKIEIKWSVHHIVNEISCQQFPLYGNTCNQRARFPFVFLSRDKFMIFQTNNPCTGQVCLHEQEISRYSNLIINKRQNWSDWVCTWITAAAAYAYIITHHILGMVYVWGRGDNTHGSCEPILKNSFLYNFSMDNQPQHHWQ